EWFLRSLSDFPDVNENGLPGFFVFHLSKAYNLFNITNFGSCSILSRHVDDAIFLKKCIRP
ncbi:MAG TPA: hypothetical protein VF343_04820, partial [Syntrophales bacterium]